MAKKIIAPKLGEENEVSFETYFLRQLYAEGKITDDFLDDITSKESNKLEILNTIKNLEGDLISKDLANSISKIARQVGTKN